MLGAAEGMVMKKVKGANEELKANILSEVKKILINALVHGLINHGRIQNTIKGQALIFSEYVLARVITSSAQLWYPSHDHRRFLSLHRVATKPRPHVSDSKI